MNQSSFSHEKQKRVCTFARKLTIVHNEYNFMNEFFLIRTFLIIVTE